MVEYKVSGGGIGWVCRRWGWRGRRVEDGVNGSVGVSSRYSSGVHQAGTEQQQQQQ